MLDKAAVTEYVKLVVEDEVKRGTGDQFLCDSDLHTLLVDDKSSPVPRETIVGYPTYPLYREIGNMLYQWLENKECPVVNLPKYELLDEKVYVESRTATFATITPMLNGMTSLWDHWGEEERKYRIRSILTLLEKRGMLDLLGIRKTVGTKEILPCSRKVLEDCFTAKHSPDSSSKLSVGARALAKHSHRDMSTSWWGVCTGTEEAKNEHALKIMNKILDNATWLNTHWLPQDIIILEARHTEGYGARWTADGSSFRGFLEPQMEGGHDAGWKH
ncbi:uncharacterized protein LOC134725866 [Mytilus trossulus]|uniref:uncharacterized protein LOC134725866 n=1 Tax=Mytilus trossulus TaxID=6551 RepID=UPI00300491F6